MGSGFQPAAGLKPGVLLVTASRRLWRALREQHNRRQAGAAEVWASPNILPWDAWLATLWDALVYSGVEQAALLAPAAERLLWERVIRESPESDQLIQIPPTAGAALESWKLARAWRLEEAALEASGGPDTLAFLGWARRFRQLCESEGWLEAARLPEAVGARLGRLELPAEIVLAGFDEFTPQQQAFLEALRERAMVRELAEEPGEPGAARRVALPSPAHEVAAAAHWARELLERGETAVGVVIADLSGRRAEVERAFREAMDEAGLRAGAPAAQGVFNLSAGLSLDRYPIVQAALQALADVSRVLCNPYLAGWEEEAARRALADRRLRQSPGSAVSPKRLGAELAGTKLGAALDRWRAEVNALPARQRPSQWSRSFSVLLERLGWPGGRPLTSHEFQTVREWSELLSELARLDAVSPALTSAEALAILRGMAAERMFQPETPEAPVEILGMLEAAGLRFRHLWIAGLDDESWPAPPRPDPFLPVALQRARGLPHASAARELEFARRTTGRLLASAPDVVVSHPASREDRELGPSPLILRLPEAVAVLAPRSAPPPAPLEEIEDAQAPAVPPGAWQRGGAAVFQLQAACPFRAFAELRLAAEPLETPVSGLDARERGVLVHQALEAIWGELKSHAALMGLSAEALANQVSRSVAAAIGRLEELRGAPLAGRFRALEQARLERLLRQWMEVEKQREPFRVLERELDREVELAGIRCRIRPDRVDLLPSGGHRLIDYKTGKCDVRDWDCPRPDEPQLPLYAVVHPRIPAAIEFAQVRRGECRPLAYNEKELPLPEAVGQWREELERLGGEFRQGRAAVDPKQPPETCKHCKLGALCRIAEADLDAPPAEDSDD